MNRKLPILIAAVSLLSLMVIAAVGGRPLSASLTSSGDPDGTGSA